MLPSGTTKTWDQLKRDFLDRYFPTAKYLASKKEISTIKKQEGEVLSDAWERFKIFLKRCLGHTFSYMDILQAFFTGLRPYTRMLLDVSAGGTMKIQELNDNMSLNQCRAHTDEEASSKKKCMININTEDDLLASNKVLSLQPETIAKNLEARAAAKLSAKSKCDLCEQAHKSEECLPTSLKLSEEQVMYMRNFSSHQRNPYSKGSPCDQQVKLDNRLG